MKHIKIFEEFGTDSTKETRAESQGGWVNIRDIIQTLKPFIIINFKKEEGYSRYIDNLDHDYIKQSHCSFIEGEETKHPSIFIGRKAYVSDDDFKDYSISSIIVGKKDNPNVKFKTADSSEYLGNEIESTLSMDDVYGSDYYQIEGMYYKFLNFLG